MKKIWGRITAKFSGWIAAAKNRRPKIISGAVSESELLAWWSVPAIFLVFAVGSIIAGSVFWMLFWVGTDLLFMGFFLKTVRDPDQANVYRLERFVGRVGAGLYIAIPYYMDLEIVQREVFKVEFEKVPMTTGAGTDVAVDIVAVFQIGKTEAALRKSLEIDQETRDRLFWHMVRSKVATAVAAKPDFKEFNKRQQDIEKDVIGHLRKEARKYGYTAKEVEVYIAEERVIKEAERIKIIGQARGEEAKAISEPYKDNWPAAAVGIAGLAFGGTVRDAKKAAGSKKGVKAASDAIGAVGKAVDAVKKVFADKDKDGGDE